MKPIYPLLDRGLLPDSVIRFGIRRLLAQRLRQEEVDQPAAVARRKRAFVEALEKSPIALHTDAANEQHYEVPTEFYQQVLGKYLKYSSGYWPRGVDDIDGSERAMLELSAERAGLADGQEILELGCGWGSMTLYMAETYPKARITAISNSATQRRHILGQAAERGLDNLEVITCDMNDFDTEQRFDRIVSIEMFEHMRNYRELFARVARWLKEDGYCFVHVFCHRDAAYPFEDRGGGDWMARYFFTGGQMPSFDLFEHFQEDVEMLESWKVSGEHYSRTSEAWLERMDANADALRPLFVQTYGDQARRFWVYWRVFFMACAELFGWRGGDEWLVGHYLFRRRRQVAEKAA
jgi:cyclopropane-fatty-acyl-phospholipid synthase